MKKFWIVAAALCLLLTATLGVLSVNAGSGILYGDADGNGKINNRDLGLLQKYLNGGDVTLGPDEPVLPPDDNKYNDTELEWN